MKNKSIFVACDTSNIEKIRKIIFQTRLNEIKIIPKFGLQFFYSKKGRKFLEKIKIDFWLDLKINDIPQTAVSALDKYGSEDSGKNLPFSSLSEDLKKKEEDKE